MNDDVSIGLLEMIQKSFNLDYEKSSKIKIYLKELEQKKADYSTANEYAIEVGEILAKVFEDIDSSKLPNGKMYYNIALKLVEPALKNNYELITNYSLEVQENLNKSANIGISAIESKINQEQINNILNKIASAEKYDDISWMLQAPIVQFSQNVVDRTIKANAEMQYKARKKATIRRKIFGNACEWCMEQAGTYNYPDVPDDVYHRHNDCRCQVTYDPAEGKGKVQDVWSKEWKKSNDASKIERKKISEASVETKKIKHNNYIKNIEVVTSEYYGFSTPRIGEINRPSEYKISKHKEEISFAEYIKSKIGGVFYLLNESENNGEMRPDYIWNNKYWELKSISTNKATDSAIRKGIKQLKKAESKAVGGIFLDCRKNNEYDFRRILELLGSRIGRSDINNIDILIVERNGNIIVLRYKK
jgi:uncharacterized protein (DUF2164 family)